MINFSYAAPETDFGLINNKMRVSSLEDVYNFTKAICESTNPKSHKYELHRILPSAFKDCERSKEEFKSTRLLGYDFDEGDVEEFFSDLEKLDIGYFLYETPSSTEDIPKFRVFFELENVITDKNEFKDIYRQVSSKYLPSVKYDVSCVDCARLFYISDKRKLDSFYLNIGNKANLKGYSEKTAQKSEAFPKKETKLSADLEDFVKESLESIERVMYRLDYIIDYAKNKEIAFTKSYQEWLDTAFACVSLHHNNNLPKKDCLSYFRKLSELDGERCAPQEKIDAFFDEKWANTEHRHSVGTLYYLAKEAGIPVPKSNPKIIKVVKASEGGVYLAKPNTESDDIVALHFSPLENKVARGKIWVEGGKTYALEEDEVFHLDEETNKKKYNETIDHFLARFREIPEKMVYKLGYKHKGTFYEKSTNTLLISNHQLLPATPIFHKDINDWLKQLPLPPWWIMNYLFYACDRTKCLALLLQYGCAGGGKTAFARLLASLWGTPPIDDYFVSSFQDTAGTNPVILMDEQIPNKAAEIKSLVTSDMTSVKQKYMKAVYIQGFPLLVVAVNNDRLLFPSETENDEGAAKRRIQAMKYEQKHADYFEKIGGFDTVNKWINLTFRQHVAYIREHPEEFHIGMYKSNDMIILPPVATEEMKETHFTFNEEDSNIVESFFMNAIKDTNDAQKECYVNVYDFRKSLVEDRITKGMVGVARVERAINKTTEDGKKVLRRHNNRGVIRWRVSKEKVLKIMNRLKLTLDEGEEDE